MNFILKLIIGIIKYIILGVLYLWCIGAVYYLNIPWEYLRAPLAWAFAILVPLCLIIFRHRWYIYWLALLVCLSIAFYYEYMPASNEGNWIASVAVMPSVTFKGNDVFIKNIRDFQYESEKDFKVHYYNKEFDLDNIESLYYVLSYWDGNKAIAHTILSFGFKGGDYLCVSVETRLKKDQPQTGLMGLYNQYGIIYVLSDEKDVLRLRTNFRNEEVYMYQVKAKKEMIRSLFVSILQKVNRLNTHPEFYNVLKENCLTSLLMDLRHARGERMEFDYRYICNGYSDKLFYERGAFQDQEMTFNEFKNLHHINQYINKDSDINDYSKEIRIFKNQTKD